MHTHNKHYLASWKNNPDSNFEKIGIVQGECPKKELKNCYHNSINTVGVKCVINENMPPCSIHNEDNIIKETNKLLNNGKWIN